MPTSNTPGDRSASAAGKLGPRAEAVQISLSATRLGAGFLHQLLLLRPTKFLDRRLPLQSCRFRILWLAIDQPYGKPTAGVSRRLAGSVGLEPLREVVGDAGVERAVGAAEYVDEPAVVRGARTACIGAVRNRWSRCPCLSEPLRRRLYYNREQERATQNKDLRQICGCSRGPRKMRFDRENAGISCSQGQL